MTEIRREKNRIIIEGSLFDFHRLVCLIHSAIEKAGYEDIELDLSKCTSAFQNSMLSLCAQVMAYRESGVNFVLTPPKKKELHRLFKNTNWGFLLDPHQFSPSSFRGYTSVPATQYQTPTEQSSAVNKIVNVILGAIPDMKRSDFAAFEWAINEITDNVLIHSGSTIGGLVQVSTFQKYTKQVEFVVADAGIGIPDSLREGYSTIVSDTDALYKAIQEGVTRDKCIGQGNGLFGSYEICSKSKGSFRIDSGHARLEYNKWGLAVTDQHIPYSGTLIVARIDFSKTGLLEQALKFKGVPHSPVDFVETEYEKDDDGRIRFIVANESKSYGSRVAGRSIRTKLTNLLRMQEGDKIAINLEGVPLMSSSFADEAFGKLFLEAGAVSFMQKFEFINVMGTVQQLINKAIAQRMAAGVVD